MNVLKKDQAQMMLQVIVAVLLFRFVLFESLIDDLGLSMLHYFAFFNCHWFYFIRRYIVVQNCSARRISR